MGGGVACRHWDGSGWTALRSGVREVTLGHTGGRGGIGQDRSVDARTGPRREDPSCPGKHVQRDGWAQDGNLWGSVVLGIVTVAASICRESVWPVAGGQPRQDGLGGICSSPFGLPTPRGSVGSTTMPRLARPAVLRTIPSSRLSQEDRTGCSRRGAGLLPGRRPIVREGEAGDAMYVLLSAGRGGRGRAFHTLRAGDFFGEMALLTARRRTAR